MYFYGLFVQKTSLDVGRTLKRLENLLPLTCDILQSLLVFFQYPAWFIELINLHGLVCYMYFIKNKKLIYKPH